MDPGTIPVKTRKGRDEVAVRTGVLTAVQRRLLILVDGRKSANDLGAFARAGELEAALDHLSLLGFVSGAGLDTDLGPPVAAGFASPCAAQAARPATSLREFEQVRTDASHFIRQRLGDAATPICTAVERCNSPHELRQVLRGVEVFVGQRLDAHTALAFARHFGAMLL